MDALLLGLWALLDVCFGLKCHQCANMFDGADGFTDIEGFKECIPDLREDVLEQCPPEDKCCFALREHISLEFWGHAIAAEVLVRGCCSSLSQLPHHLASSRPAPLAMSDQFMADVLSPVERNGPFKTRGLFCNTEGCNSGEVPWSSRIILSATSTTTISTTTMRASSSTNAVYDNNRLECHCHCLSKAIYRPLPNWPLLFIINSLLMLT